MLRANTLLSLVICDIKYNIIFILCEINVVFFVMDSSRFRDHCQKHEFELHYERISKERVGDSVSYTFSCTAGNWETEGK